MNIQLGFDWLSLQVIQKSSDINTILYGNIKYN